MKITPSFNMNFGSCIPIKLYARYKGEENNFRRVYSSEEDNYMSRCQGMLSRNLNGKAAKPNNEFIEAFKRVDSDYKDNPVVHSVYDNYKSIVYLFTGNDAAVTKAMAEDVGKARAAANKRLDNEQRAKSPDNIYVYEQDAQRASDTPEAKKAARNYFDSVFRYARTCKRIKTSNNKPAELHAYFEANKTKKGDKITSFELYGGRLYDSEVQFSRFS